MCYNLINHSLLALFHTIKLHEEVVHNMPTGNSTLPPGSEALEQYLRTHLAIMCDTLIAIE